jgi:hypothetical protein
VKLKLFAAAMRREDMAKQNRRPFTFYLDEYMNYPVPAINGILEEGRKMGINAVLLTQNVMTHMRDERMLASVLNNSGHLFSFRLSWQEADSLVREIFRPKMETPRERYWQDGKVMGFSVPQERHVWYSIEELWEQERQRIMQLQNRELWWKQKGSFQTLKLRTLGLIDFERLAHPDVIDEARELMLNDVRLMYGRPKATPPPPLVILVEEDDPQGYT